MEKVWLKIPRRGQGDRQRSCKSLQKQHWNKPLESGDTKKRHNIRQSWQKPRKRATVRHCFGL